MYKCNYEVEPRIIFAEGEEPWLTITTEVSKVDETSAIFYTAITYVILPNDSEKPRSATIMVSPKDHPGYEMALIEVAQAGKPAEGGSGSGEGVTGE
jgi:hypothetical protein